MIFSFEPNIRLISDSGQNDRDADGIGPIIENSVRASQLHNFKSELKRIFLAKIVAL